MSGCENPILSTAMQIHRCARQIRETESALEELPPMQNPAFSGATTMRTLAPGDSIIVVGYGNQAKARVIEPVSPVVCSYSPKGESLFISGSDEEIFDLADIGVIPDKDGTWSESFLSIPDNMEAILATIDWLLELDIQAFRASDGPTLVSNRGAEESAALLRRYVRDVHGLGRHFDFVCDLELA